MHLTCSQCHQKLKIPDALAGKTVKCPRCHAPFTVPPPEAAPAPVAPPEPAAELPEAAVPEAVPAPVPAPAAAAAHQPEQEKQKEETPSPSPSPAPRRRVLDPELLPWVVPGCFLLMLVLLFFPWLSLSAGGRTIFSQSGLDVAFAGGAKNYPDHPELQARLQEFFSIAPEPRPAGGWWTFLFLLVLLLGILAGVGAVVVDRLGVAAARSLLRWRFPVLAGLSAAALLLLLLQMLVGFPLANQFQAQVEQDQQALRSRANQADEGLERQARLDWVEIQGGIKQSLLRYGLSLRLALLLAVAACGAAVLGVRQQRRAAPALPPPQTDSTAGTE
jgi:hypothetical protein